MVTENFSDEIVILTNHEEVVDETISGKSLIIRADDVVIKSRIYNCQIFVYGKNCTFNAIIDSPVLINEGKNTKFKDEVSIFSAELKEKTIFENFAEFAILIGKENAIFEKSYNIEIAQE